MAKEFGVHPDTLRRWEEGADRASREHRRWRKTLKLSQVAPPRSMIGTVSEGDDCLIQSIRNRAEDLVRQVALFKSLCATNSWSYELISDVGSRLSYRKEDLHQLISRICSGNVGRLVLSHKD